MTEGLRTLSQSMVLLFLWDWLTVVETLLYKYTGQHIHDRDGVAGRDQLA